MQRGKRRIAAWGLAALAAMAGGIWGHWLVQHRLFRYGPHDQPVYDAERNAIYDPGLDAWRDLDSYELHRYTPDSPLMPYILPFLGVACFAFFVFAVSWTVKHRRLMGKIWLAFVRQPVTMLLRYLPLLGLAWISAGVPFLRAGEDLDDLLADRPTAIYVGVVVGQIAVPLLLVFAPWAADRLFVILHIAFRVQAAHSGRNGSGVAKQDALRRAAQHAERFRLSASGDLSALAWMLGTGALMDVLAERGDDTAVVDDLLRDGPAALGASRHTFDRIFSALGQPEIENKVARAFIFRYEWTGAVVNLERAIDILAPLAAKPRPWFWLTMARWRVVCLNLAVALKDRYELRRDPADLDQALALVRKVGRRYPSRVSNYLLELELFRYRDTSDPAALTAAIRAGRRGEPDPDMARALLERFADGGDHRDLAEAQELAARLVEEKGPGHPWHAVCLTVHARALAASGETDGAVQCLRQAVNSPSSPLQSRLAAAMSLGELGAGGPVSVEGYGAAVELLPQLAWIGLRRDDQRWLLSRWQGVSTAAAAAAITAGEVEQAVEILEHGRAIMWGQLARLRGRAEAVRTADPALARRLDEIRAELDVPDEPGWRFDEAGADVERRIRLGREWDELSARLGMTRRRDYQELSGAAADGPVVVVNVSPLRCDAIVLLPDDDPVLVPLDGLDHAELVAWARQSVDSDGRHQAMLNVIAPRLWDDLAVPVLRAVAPHLGESRRIWWCPTGPLAALPLHAAGHHTRPGGPALLDNVVSSYTPTISALLQSSERVVEPRGSLAVAARQSFERPDLPAVDEEAEEFLRCIPDAMPLSPARVADVLERLPGSHWVHFACHADASGLAVTDGTVSLEQIADLHLADAEFCYLSACSTAAPDPRAYDESVHLAALLHLQSFVHVVGTLWEVDSDKALQAAREVYRTLTEHGAPDSTLAAQAVHNAAQALRREAPRDVDVWSSLLHIGP